MSGNVSRPGRPRYAARPGVASLAIRLCIGVASGLLALFVLFWHPDHRLDGAQSLGGGDEPEVLLESGNADGYGEFRELPDHRRGERDAVAAPEAAQCRFRFAGHGCLNAMVPG